MLKKVEIISRKFLLQLLLIFNPTKKSSSIPEIDNTSNVLLIRLNRIGDALVSTAFIKVLKESSNCRITILADKKNHFVFSNNQYIDDCIVFEKGFSGILQTKNRINSSAFNTIIDLHDDTSTTVSYLISLCKTQIKIGLKKGNDKVYTHLVDRIDSSKYHVIDRQLEIADYLHLSYNKKDVNIVYNYLKYSESYNLEFLESNFAERKYLLGINISAGSDARFWGVENYKKLITEINQKYDVNILLITAHRDVELAKQISDGKLPVYCEQNFDKFANIIEKLDFLFTPDTSIIHLASAYNVPLFGLYVKYNTKDIIWYPYQSEYETIITEEPDFKNLTYDEVKNKFFPFFDKFIIKDE